MLVFDLSWILFVKIKSNHSHPIILKIDLPSEGRGFDFEEVSL